MKVELDDLRLGISAIMEECRAGIAEFEIGDTVALDPSHTSLSVRVSGSVCYRYDEHVKHSGIAPEYRSIYKLDSTGEIIFDGSGFAISRIVLTEKSSANLINAFCHKKQ